MERGGPGRPDRTPLPSEETGSGPAAHRAPPARDPHAPGDVSADPPPPVMMPSLHDGGAMRAPPHEDGRGPARRARPP